MWVISFSTQVSDLNSLERRGIAISLSSHRNSSLGQASVRLRHHCQCLWADSTAAGIVMTALDVTIAEEKRLEQLAEL